MISIQVEQSVGHIQVIVLLRPAAGALEKQDGVMEQFVDNGLGENLEPVDLLF